MSEITTWYLEMLSAADLTGPRYQGEMQVQEMKVKQYQVNRFLYQFVGDQWQWHDNLSWSDAEWQAYAERENLRTWLATLHGSIAGYFELLQEEGSTEIAYLGLAPGFIGGGHGGFLLSEAIRAAWNWDGTKRVWLHTCNLDHPNALKNYQARGLKIYREETR